MSKLLDSVEYPEDLKKYKAGRFASLPEIRELNCGRFCFQKILGIFLQILRD